MGWLSQDDSHTYQFGFNHNTEEAPRTERPPPIKPTKPHLETTCYRLSRGYASVSCRYGLMDAMAIGDWRRRRRRQHKTQWLLMILGRRNVPDDDGCDAFTYNILIFMIFFGKFFFILHSGASLPASSHRSRQHIHTYIRIRNEDEIHIQTKHKSDTSALVGWCRQLLFYSG